MYAKIGFSGCEREKSEILMEVMDMSAELLMQSFREHSIDAEFED